ncbi:hypothetical protein AVEN_172353-1 [Araneus ventricosus]|uniref:Uncharacterized protein n=1 Tax=Araneus ventricosus TaxID=182803 RepID=A0A4Y2E1Q7_ARAVE|nr:hypothetical protein AVEN_172353-1 [Araneus ventricosus]
MPRHIPVKALFRRRVAWQTSSRLRFVLVECGRWNSEQFRHSYGAWFGKYLGSDRVNGCTDAVWPLSLPSLCEIFTAITRETTDTLTNPRAISILPVPTMVNNANSGRNSWKDRP